MKNYYAHLRSLLTRKPVTLAMFIVLTIAAISIVYGLHAANRMAKPASMTANTSSSGNMDAKPATPSSDSNQIAPQTTDVQSSGMQSHNSSGSTMGAPQTPTRSANRPTASSAPYNPISTGNDPATDLAILKAQREADESKAAIKAYEACMADLTTRRSAALAPVVVQRDQAYQEMILFQTNTANRIDLTQAQKDRILATDGATYTQKWVDLQNQVSAIYKQFGSC